MRQEATKGADIDIADSATGRKQITHREGQNSIWTCSSRWKTSPCKCKDDNKGEAAVPDFFVSVSPQIRLSNFDADQVLSDAQSIRHHSEGLGHDHGEGRWCSIPPTRSRLTT